MRVTSIYSAPGCHNRRRQQPGGTDRACQPFGHMYRDGVDTVNYQEPDFDTTAIVDLTEANVSPVPDTPAWDAEMSHLRADAAGHRITPQQAVVDDIIDKATAAG